MLVYQRVWHAEKHLEIIALQFMRRGGRALQHVSPHGWTCQGRRRILSNSNGFHRHASHTATWILLSVLFGGAITRSLHSERNSEPFWNEGHPVADMSNYMCLKFYAVHLLRSASWLPEQGVATACWFVNHASFGDGEGEILQLNWRMLPPPFQARRGKILEILQLPDIWKDSIRQHSCVGLCDDIST